MGTSLIRNIAPLGPYSKAMSRALWWPSRGGGLFLMSEVPLYTETARRGARGRTPPAT